METLGAVTRAGALISTNPATGETLGRFEVHDEREIERRLAVAHDAFRHGRRRPLAERTAPLIRLAEILETESERLGALMTLEMGKLLAAAKAEAEKCALACRYYAEHAEHHLAPEITRLDGEEVRVEFQPLGVILAVMPWNFPFWQVIRFAAPAIAAGNTVLLKHASNVPRCALEIESLFRRAGFREGSFETLLAGPERVASLIADDRIAAVTLTGSERAGASVGEHAGRHIKPAVMELGGSDPFIVMPSADLPAAVRTAVTARTINNGQSCIAAKRFLIADSIADRFLDGFVAGMRALRVGDPMKRETQVGPLATPAILDDLDRQVRDTLAMGGVARCGGSRIDRPGNWYEPTVLTDIPADSPAFVEELFGPVAAVFRVPDATAAIALANASRYGLGAAVWTTDRSEAERFAAELETGTVFVNGMVASDPRFPFGGVKKSGYGRELGREGIREFVNVKTIRISGLAAGPGTVDQRSATE